MNDGAGNFLCFRVFAVVGCWWFGLLLVFGLVISQIFWGTGCDCVWFALVVSLI